MQVKVSIDIYGERVFNGVVDSLSAGSAASFALPLALLLRTK